jgi:cold shock CspA family protein
MTQGRIARLVPDREFGFIKAHGQEYFFHASELQGAAFEELAEGSLVEFEPAIDPRAEGPRAERVQLANEA